MASLTSRAKLERSWRIFPPAAVTLRINARLEPPLSNCFAALTKSNAMARPEEAKLAFEDSKDFTTPEL
jgi:hypothetical protein